MLLIGRHDYWPGYTPDVIKSLDFDYWPHLAIACDKLSAARADERREIDRLKVSNRR